MNNQEFMAQFSRNTAMNEKLASVPHELEKQRQIKILSDMQNSFEKITTATEAPQPAQSSNNLTNLFGGLDISKIANIFSGSGDLKNVFSNLLPKNMGGLDGILKVLSSIPTKKKKTVSTKEETVESEIIKLKRVE